MMTQLTAKVAVVAVVLLMASHGAHATTLPCPTIGCGGHPAPAPLLAAGIPAFVALGGGVAARRLWQKFGRRS